MVLGLAQAADHSCCAAGVERGAGDDLLEQLGRHRPTAAERHQHPAGREQLEREQVEVLVGAAGLVELSVGGRQLGRIEQDQVVLSSAVAQAAQRGERVGHLQLADVDTVQLAVAGGDRQCRLGRVDAEDRLRPCPGGHHAEGPGVGEHVQHTGTGGEPGDGRPGLALVEVEAGLVATGNVDGVAPLAFVGDEVGRRLRAAEQADAGPEPFALAHIGVAAFEHARHARQAGQRIGDRIAEAFRTHRGELHHHRVAVTIGGQAW